MLFVADLARYLRFSIAACTLLVALLPRLAVAQDAENAWDFDPYRVLVWIVDPNRKEVAAGLETPLRNYLDYDFSAVWRVDIQDAPAVARVAAIRDLQSLDYDQLTSADPVLAVRKDHPDAPRIRSPEDVGENGFVVRQDGPCEPPTPGPRTLIGHSRVTANLESRRHAPPRAHPECRPATLRKSRSPNSYAAAFPNPRPLLFG